MTIKIWNKQTPEDLLIEKENSTLDKIKMLYKFSLVQLSVAAGHNQLSIIAISYYKVSDASYISAARNKPNHNG